MSYRFAESLRAGAFAPARKLHGHMNVKVPSCLRRVIRPTVNTIICTLLCTGAESKCVSGSKIYVGLILNLWSCRPLSVE